jgi:hypothetical protein
LALFAPLPFIVWSIIFYTPNIIILIKPLGPTQSKLHKNYLYEKAFKYDCFACGYFGNRRRGL